MTGFEAHRQPFEAANIPSNNLEVLCDFNLTQTTMSFEEIDVLAFDESRDEPINLHTAGGPDEEQRRQRELIKHWEGEDMYGTTTDCNLQYVH